MKQFLPAQGAIDRTSDSLAVYLKEINKVPLLSTDEEVAAIKQYREGNAFAFEKIVRANLRFVISVAKFYQFRGLSLPDLICEGNLGLLKAVERFDETRGFKFISYAVWWIRQSIIRSLNEHSRIIRLPRDKVASLHKIRLTFKQLEQEFERDPTFEELSNLSGLEPEIIKAILPHGEKHLSLDAPGAPGGAKSLSEIFEDANAESADKQMAYSESLEMAVRFSLTVLNKNQSDVIKMYYGFEGEKMNHREISQKLKVSSERIRQIKKAALTRIKNSGHSPRLKEHRIRPSRNL